MTMDHFGDDGGTTILITQEAHCRFAYTLNNTQPVRCSIIGDQPLFYMDFEGEIEDEFTDESADPFGIDLIEQGIEALKQKLIETELSMKLDGAMIGEESQIRLADFIDEAGFIGQTVKDGDVDGLRLKRLEKILRASRTVGAYLDHAAQWNVQIRFSKQIELAFYDRDSGTIFLNPMRDETDLALLMMRELRRMWQHKNGALINPLTFHPDQAILIHRAQKADLAVAMVRGAWDLQLSGEKGPWNRLETSALEDLARAMAREAYLDFRTLNNGAAAAAVFEAWFMSERCRLEDRALIQVMLSDYQGYVFENEQASLSITNDLLVALGSQPLGKNYLAPVMNTVLSDPLFTEIRDRSNANFLWFIKFERSFREAEQDLQTHSVSSAPENPSVRFNENNTDGDNAASSTIVPLPGRAGRASHKRGDSKIAAGGNVVAFAPRTERQGP